jgi:putative hydrolase
LAQQLDEIAELNDKLGPFRVLTGIEVDILADGALDHGDDVLGALDLVVASVHSKLRMPGKEMTERMVRAVANPHVDVLGHCTTRWSAGVGPRARSTPSWCLPPALSPGQRSRSTADPNDRSTGRVADLALEWGCFVSVDLTPTPRPA